MSIPSPSPHLSLKKSNYWRPLLYWASPLRAAWKSFIQSYAMCSLGAPQAHRTPVHAPKCSELEEESGNLGTELFAWQAVGSWLFGSELLLGQSGLVFILPV